VERGRKHFLSPLSQERFSFFFFFSSSRAYKEEIIERGVDKKVCGPPSTLSLFRSERPLLPKVGVKGEGEASSVLPQTPFPFSST